MFFDDFSFFRKELQDAATVDIIAFNASITAMARSGQWQHALTLSLHLRCHGNLNSENQSSRDTGGPGIEAGFPLVFHWANISTPIPA